MAVRDRFVRNSQKYYKGWATPIPYVIGGSEGNQNLHVRQGIFLPFAYLAHVNTAKGGRGSIRQIYRNNKREAEASLLLLVDLRGIEPLSENLLIQLSPGAEYLLTLFPHRAGTQAR